MKKQKELVGIILAGGRGKRLGVLTEHIPKPLLQVNDKTLISYAIDFVKQVGVTKLIVVGGYLVDLLSEEVKKHYPSTVITIADHTQHTLDGFSYALPHLVDGDDVFVCNSDYIFNSTTAHEVKKNLEQVSVYCSYDKSISMDDIMKVKETDNKKLVDMSKKLSDFESVFTGAFFCSSTYVQDMIRITKDLLIKVDKTTTSVERLLMEMSSSGLPVYVRDIGKADWFEIDTPEEWQIAKDALEK